MPETHQVLLHGGGLDSTALFLHLADHMPIDTPLSIVHIDYGQKAAKQEFSAITRQFKALKSLKHRPLILYPGSMDLGFSQASIMEGQTLGEQQSDNQLYFRNPLLLLYAASLMRSRYPNPEEPITLNVAFHVEPSNSAFPDAKTPYLAMLEEMFKELGDNIQIKTPLSHLTREEIFQIGIEYTPDFYKYAYTCYEKDPCVAGSDTMCLHCKFLADMLYVKQVSLELI